MAATCRLGFAALILAAIATASPARADTVCSVHDSVTAPVPIRAQPTAKAAVVAMLRPATDFELVEEPKYRVQRRGGFVKIRAWADGKLRTRGVDADWGSGTVGWLAEKHQGDCG